MKLSVISKYKMTAAFRHALSPITSDNILRRQFSPKRCMLEVVFPIADGPPLHVVDVHLSAFAQGSNTMSIQVGQVAHLLEKFEKEDQSGIIGGDFNLLPPGKAFSRLNEKGQSYFNPQGTELIPLTEKFFMIPALANLNGEDYKNWLTNYSVYGEKSRLDKTIDYFFMTRDMKSGRYYVRHRGTDWISDHLPLIATIQTP